MSRAVQAKTMKDEFAFADGLREGIPKMGGQFQEPSDDYGKAAHNVESPAVSSSRRIVSEFPLYPSAHASLSSDDNIRFPSENKELHDPSVEGENVTFKFSLDDFVDPEFTRSIDVQPINKREGASSEPKMPESRPSVDRRKIARNKKILLMSTAFLMIAVSVAFLVKLIVTQTKPEPTKLVRHSIPATVYQEASDFIILSDTGSGKALISVRVEFQFSTENWRENFQRDGVGYRDALYGFLTKIYQPGEDQKNQGRSSVEKELVDYFKSTFPKSGVRSLRIAELKQL